MFYSIGTRSHILEEHAYTGRSGSGFDPLESHIGEGYVNDKNARVISGRFDEDMRDDLLFYWVSGPIAGMTKFF